MNFIKFVLPIIILFVVQIFHGTAISIWKLKPWTSYWMFVFPFF